MAEINRKNTKEHIMGADVTRTSRVCPWNFI